MTRRSIVGRLGALRWVFLASVCAPHCVEESSGPVRSDADAGAGGDTPAPAPSENGGAAGESFGPTVICGKRTVISDCDPFAEESCAPDQVCDHFVEFGGFRCYENPEPAGAGEFCDDKTVKCAPGLGCETTELMVCQHFCCDDSDCMEGICYGGYFEDGEATLGYCFEEYGGRCAFGLGEPGECEGTAGAGGSAP
jgi:hypothetical protein